VLYPNLPLDLIEALTYGREWQLGYDKLPPLPWWLVEITYRIFGRDLYYYALAQAAVIAAFALIWKSARPLVGPLGALAALLIVDGLHYVHLGREIQPDVINCRSGRSLDIPSTRSAAESSFTGCCWDWQSELRYGRNISSPCWLCRLRFSCCLTHRPSGISRRPDLMWRLPSPS
jgi:hypothetical protein